MPASAPKAKPKPSKATGTLTAPQVLSWLQGNPAFFTEHADALQTLALPAKGGNILSLHAARAQKSIQTAEKLELRQRRFVATARDNAQVAGTIFRAVLALMSCRDMAGLRQTLQTSLKTELNLDAVRLLRLADTASTTTLTADEMATLTGGHAVTLRSLTTVGERKFYGPKGTMLKSDALLHLSGPSGRPLGLLALASREETRFHAGQSTDLAVFLAEAVGACMARLDG